jgi:hypothetical protein
LVSLDRGAAVAVVSAAHRVSEEEEEEQEGVGVKAVTVAGAVAAASPLRV